MPTKVDVLVAFAEKDNANIPNNPATGWVTHFCHYLKMMLTQVMGREPVIIPKSEHQALETEPKTCSTLLTVLSHDFIASEACLELVEDYQQAMGTTSANRIFKVLKGPLRNEEQPALVRKINGYDFYHTDPETGEKFTLSEYFGEGERDFWMKLVDLCYDLHTVLGQLEKKNTRKKKESKRGIYLAETGPDLTVQRNILKRELRRHGYEVHPQSPLPSNNQELEEVVENEIAKCKISIHLIGSAYGDIPEGGERSVMDIQNKIAATRSIQARKDPSLDFSRFIWITPHLGNASDQQKNFVENLQRDLSATEGAEVMQSSLEDFKNIVREELLEERMDRVYKLPHLNIGEDKKIIYLIHDKVDGKEVSKIKRLIQQKGFHVLFPAFDGNLLGMRHHHIENLKSFDAAIIYKGHVTDQWVKMKLLDVLKSPGFGRLKAIAGKAVLVDAKMKIDKQIFSRHPDITFIEGADEKQMKQNLDYFLEELVS